MTQCFPVIFQNEKLRQRLADEIREKRFPHAYILAGKPGTGKRTFALQIAAALSCKSHAALPCGVCDSCQKILGGFSPDVIRVRKHEDKKEFTIDLIREIKENLYIAPNELEKRVYILEDTELMNANTQNAFLKMLEEPPAYVVFLLLCADTEKLLETVKSRAPILHTEQIPADKILAFLTERSAAARELQANAPERLKSIALGANGSIGAALSLCEEGGKHEERRETVYAFLQAWTAHSLAELDLFCDRLPANADEFLLFLSELKKALRDVAVYKHTPVCDLLFFTDADSIDALAARVTAKKALHLIEASDALAEKMKFYLDIRLAAVTFCADARKIMLE